MNDFFASKGTLHQLSCVERPQQNGAAECKHQHILNVARAIWFLSNLPLFFFLCWLCLNFLHISLIFYTPILNNKSLYEPSYSHLEVFGHLCFASTLSQHRSKFDARARKCVFIRYPTGVKVIGSMILKLTLFFSLEM